MLDYQTGLDKYFGLVAIAEKYNIFKKVSTRFEMPDGTKAFEKTIVNNPEKYFTEDIMKQLEDAVKFGEAGNHNELASFTDFAAKPSLLEYGAVH